MKKILKSVALLVTAGLIIQIAPVLTFRRQRNLLPLPAAYKKGVFHVHSIFSDGLGDIGEITADAAKCGLSFVILTDHGRPNRSSSAATQWRDRTLLIGASEFSLNGGHMSAVGYRVHDYIFPPESQEAIDEVNRDGGVTFIAHPLDRKIPWTDWSATSFSGIEVISAYTSARNNPVQSLLVFPWQYLFRSDFALLSLLRYPEKEMEAWDGLNRSGAYYGIYALDAHAKLQVSRQLRFRFPSYETMFRMLTVYAKVDGGFTDDPRQSASRVVSALKHGNFFNVIESLAPANGFESFYQPRGGRAAAMGEFSDLWPGEMVLKLPFSFPTQVVMKKDGRIFKKILARGQTEVRISIEQSGVYRTEIFLAGSRFGRLPWIMTNPVFIGRRPFVPHPAPVPPKPAARLPGPGIRFQIEKNPKSRASLAQEAAGDGSTVSSLDFALCRESPETADFWAALALRNPIDLSPYRGLVFTVRGDTRMRLWAQFRTRRGGSEDAYQYSFPADREWKTIALPFPRFHHLYGNGSTMNLADANAIFFIIDSNLAFSGKKGKIDLRDIGLY
jgi:hypothetical protein